MTFLDRPLINNIELLHVPAVGPALLTQRFVTGSPTGTPPPLETPQQHLANWTDSGLPAGQSTRLFRALELLGTSDRSAGMSAGGRVPGRININTLWDTGSFLVDQTLSPTGAPTPNNNPAIDPSFAAVLPSPTPTSTRLGSNDVFRGLCDASPSNRFNQQQPDVDLVYARLMRSRTQNPLGIPGPFDRPFRGFALPISQGAPSGDTQYSTQYSAPDMTQPPGGAYSGSAQAPNNGIGVEDTLLRSAPYATPAPGTPPTPPPANPRFGVGGQHPYLQSELLRKIAGSVTTHSNVFAVWVTVGLFEVTDETTNPVKLGKEVGSDIGTQKRVRFFSIIDRTNLSIDPTAATPVPVFNPTGGYNTYTVNSPASATGLKQAPKPFFLPFRPVLIQRASAASLGPPPVNVNDLKVTSLQITSPGLVTVTLPALDLSGYLAQAFGAPGGLPINAPNQANTPTVPPQGGTTTVTLLDTNGNPIGMPNPAQTQPPPQPALNFFSQKVDGVYEGFPWQTYQYNFVFNNPTQPVGAPVLASNQPIRGIIGTPTGPTTIPPDNVPPSTAGQPTPPGLIPTSGPISRSMLLIDDGDRQEMVFVEKVETTVIQDGNGNPVLVPTLTFTTTKPHAAGCTISNVPLGNPGPQGPIDWSADNFRHVVPLATILE
jgi:hypothetical protein